VSQETTALLKIIYRVTLTSDTKEDIQSAIRTMLSAEDVAYVEKELLHLNAEHEKHEGA